jgi:hypothetical protein
VLRTGDRRKSRCTVGEKPQHLVGMSCHFPQDLFAQVSFPFAVHGSRSTTLNPLRFNVWLGVAAEPLAEARRSKLRVFTRGEALIVHVYAVVQRAGVGDNLSGVPICAEELPD